MNTEMKTETMTRAELNRRINEDKGWEWWTHPSWGNEAMMLPPDHYDAEARRRRIEEDGWRVLGNLPDGWRVQTLPGFNWTGNGNAALSLLDELPVDSLDWAPDGYITVRLWYEWEKAEEAFPWRGTPYPHFCLAVTVAWYEWRHPGVRVRVVEEEAD